MEVFERTRPLQKVIFDALLSKPPIALDHALRRRSEEEEAEDDGVYEVQGFKRFRCKDAMKPKTYEFLTEWKRHGPSHDTWTKLEELGGSLKKIFRFFER